MRLTELSLEKYGRYRSLTVAIPEEAGLTVVYGLNEAGKSTCLEAITDFFFGIHPRSSRGETYGNQNIRIGASMRLKNNDRLSLRRRKGNTRTLSDARSVVDESLLVSTVLGATTRERFETLFGLNHETLRSGGGNLLAANGEIGQLIVEAGGGLRAMVRRLEAIDAEADTLFARTQSQGRKFYQGLAAFRAADEKAKVHLLTRDKYEEAREKAAGAKAAAAKLDTESADLGVSRARLERVRRVGPILRERDRLVLDKRGFADTAGYPEEFSRKVHDALKARADAAKAYGEAVDRRGRVKGRIDALSVSEALLAAEATIKSLSKRAAQVAGMRLSRPKREGELDDAEAKIHPLRGLLGLPATTDLSTMLPERLAIDRVHALVTEATAQKLALEAADDRVEDLTGALGRIDARIAEDKASGYDRALGVAAAEFGSLVVQKASLEARQTKAEKDKRGIEEEAARLGFGTADDLSTIVCPDAEDVRTEMAARERIEKDRFEQERAKRNANAAIAAALEQIAELEAIGAIATVAAVVEARERRDDLWRPIRASFVDGRVEESAEARRSAAQAFEGRIANADGLSDQRANQGERAGKRTALEGAISAARRTIGAAEREIEALAKALAVREAAFAAAYPDVSSRFPTLAGLLDFSTRRKDLLGRIEGLRAEAAAVGVGLNELAPVVDLLSRMEAKFGLAATAKFAQRLEAVQAKIAEHGVRHAGHVRDLAARDDTATRQKDARAKRDSLCARREIWEKGWPGAIAALGGSAATSPAEGGRLATEWAVAAGVLTTISQARHRIQRMDEDETDLLRDVSTTAKALGIAVGDDGVAGAEILQRRWDENNDRRVTRNGLMVEFDEAEGQAVRSKEALGSAEDALTALASAIGVGTEGLSAAAERFEARRSIEDKIAEAERRAVDAGDQLPLASLEEEWGVRNLDIVRAELDAIAARSERIGEDLKAAILMEKEGIDALEKFASESEVNRAVAERESAAADMHQALERYLELTVARDLIREAIAEVRAEQQDPLVARAGALFAAMTEGEFVGIETDVDDRELPVVKGKRANGEEVAIKMMSDGTGDQLFLAFRLASIERYGELAEPFPFVADDILVHFDGPRSRATLKLLAEFGERNQVLLFTHDEGIRDATAQLVREGRTNLVELPKVG